MLCIRYTCGTSCSSYCSYDTSSFWERKRKEKFQHFASFFVRNDRWSRNRGDRWCIEFAIILFRFLLVLRELKAMYSVEMRLGFIRRTKNMNCECDRKWMNIGIIENSEICEEWEKSWNAMKWRYCDDHTGIYRLLIRSIWIWSNLFFWKFLFIYIILLILFYLK